MALKTVSKGKMAFSVATVSLVAAMAVAFGGHNDKVTAVAPNTASKAGPEALPAPTAQPVSPQIAPGVITAAQAKQLVGDQKDYDVSLKQYPQGRPSNGYFVGCDALGTRIIVHFKDNAVDRTYQAPNACGPGL